MIAAVLGWRFLPHLAGAAAAIGLVVWFAASQRQRGRTAERIDQIDRSSETATEIRKRKDENARDAVSGNARDRLRDGAARLSSD